MKKTPFKNGDIRQIYPGGPHLFTTAEEARRFINLENKARGRRKPVCEDEEDDDEDPEYFAICISNGEALRWFRLHGKDEVRIENDAHEAKLSKLLAGLGPEEIKMLKAMI